MIAIMLGVTLEDFELMCGWFKICSVSFYSIKCYINTTPGAGLLKPGK